jgi:NadR type nicotinamide-nucleotide adenylyltransferase
LNISSQKIVRIAITGPESTGKSTLAKQLAEHYHTTWVPEFARSYLDQLGHSYRESDLVKIAKGQMEAESEAAAKANQLLFCDTEMIVLKIWSEYKYGRTHPFIISSVEKVNYDLYLLMDIDLPWAFDPQREHPDKRKYFFEWYERELRIKNAPKHIIRGDFETRFKHARSIIDRLL